MPHNPQQRIIARCIVQTQEAREMMMINRLLSSPMDREHCCCHIYGLLPNQVEEQ